MSAPAPKPPLSLLQILNMSIGLFGIQFGWGLQMGNMSAIYEYLGAAENELPLLWLAAPLTGLIVQPIIGHMSDRTWGPLGRMKQLAVVQFFTWMGLFCMWIFFPVAVTRNVLGATDTGSDIYKAGIDLANNCNATYNLVAVFSAMSFLWLGRIASAKWIHVVSLTLGGLGLASVGVVRDPVVLQWVSFSAVGIAWASILSMPYAILSNALPPARMGVYMGIFNFFIVLPQILVAILLGRLIEGIEGFNRLSAVVLGGVCLLVAAGFTLGVRLNDAERGRA